MNDLKKIAIQADISENIDRTSGCNLEEATHIMNRSFTSCLTNSNTNLRTSNMLGTYKMINILLSVHSYLNTLDLCKSLIGAVETEPDLASIERFPKSDQVTFHYYYGRMEFFKEKFTKAEDHLMKAFKLCHNSHKNNQKRILIYLIPILIYRGVLPDIKYNKLLDQHQDRLSKMHVLLMFERLRLMCLRNLCKKVYINLDKPKRLTFEQIHIALNCAGFECDEDEAVGVFSTMISKKYALGYVAYTHNLVMISEKVGFYRLPLPKA
ncbi:hypothetical protein CONCODRAFT_77289 [Conidiobolus coronatus NRRL 28638]|uniref:PCI domain-containing protein n=1 Tax=Conidiobolus coronatus (strain ATCC 28846 / CBS 209.66 / NRRL 28638) TaxID=796925 RepID=A0A137PEX4_CONC2|nr:hypothetical protein CONCODRAFT_77289 [Conidiobolus coronatus NRRL 28638]|eukprot:KXN73540.1 hypothetical protein CONCODRAFT_77289 [Conidiobolus coronatus NRRL 28638]